MSWQYDLDRNEIIPPASFLELLDPATYFPPTQSADNDPNSYDIPSPQAPPYSPITPPYSPVTPNRDFTPESEEELERDSDQETTYLPGEGEGQDSNYSDYPSDYDYGDMLSEAVPEPTSDQETTYLPGEEDEGVEEQRSDSGYPSDHDYSQIMGMEELNEVLDRFYGPD